MPHAPSTIIAIMVARAMRQPTTTPVSTPLPVLSSHYAKTGSPEAPRLLFCWCRLGSAANGSWCFWATRTARAVWSACASL